MEFTGIRFDSASEALQWTEACGGCAITTDEGAFVVSTTEATRLERAGVEMAYLYEVEDHIITVPVNG
jgi:hypothetical protein